MAAAERAIGSLLFGTIIGGALREVGVIPHGEAGLGWDDLALITIPSAVLFVLFTFLDDRESRARAQDSGGYF